MSYPVNPELEQRVKDWIVQTASTENISVTIYPGKITRDGNWLHVPVAVNQGEDAYDRASLLQRIENLWEPTAQDNLELLLVPAKPGRPAKTNGYEQLHALMERQRQLIDQIDTAAPDDETVHRFQAIRQEWEETLVEMEHLYPS